MKFLVTVAMLLSVGLLSACTSIEHQSAYVAPAEVNYPHGVKVETDSDYVSRVETLARRRGITVQWVNLPSKRTAVAKR